MEQPAEKDASQFFTPEVILHIIVKRRWLLIVPLMIALVVGSCLAVFLPKKYEAQTLILIEGQRVPTEYVQSLVTEAIDERINTLSQQILSRTNLEKIINEFGLYQEPEFEDKFMEDKVEFLRESIQVEVSTDRTRREANAFTINYKGTNPERVMRITNALASYFIDENLRVREAQAIGTSSFLEEELKNMRKRLEEQEQAVERFRTENMGVLPEQLETNLRILDRLQEELTERQESLRDARTRLTALQNQPVVIDSSANGNDTGPQDINQLQATLAQLQTRYTDKHPDIIKLKQQIRHLEENPPKPQIATTSTNPLAMEVRIEIGNLQADIGSIQNQIREYEKRVESTPGREQELLGLQRDYQNLRESYSSLLNRKLEAEIAVNMERKQKGEQFRVIDIARLPKRPVEPDMLKLFIGTIIAGIGCGCGIIFALEYFNKSFRSVQELQTISSLPTLAMIPMIETKRHRIFKKLNWICTGFSVIITLVMLIFFTVLALRGIETVMDIFQLVKITVL